MFEDGGEAMDLEKRLEREMTELGPLVQRRRQAEAEGVDPVFAAKLRTRLLTMPVKDNPSEAPPPLPLATRRRSFRGGARWIVFASAVAAVLVALLLGHRVSTPAHPVAIATPIPRGTPIVAMVVPTPNARDLLQAYPLGSGGGGMLVPESSVLDIPGVSYAGHLRIAPATLRPQPPAANAFRLASPHAVASRIGGLARQLGIRAAPKRATNTTDHTPWVVAADGGIPPGPALHSIAVSWRTGELIYHDGPAAAGRPDHAHPLDSARAVAYTRHWLTALGWPGAAMPVQAAMPLPRMFPPSAGVPWQVSLGWAGAGIAAVPDATLWITPRGRVFEARVWPPVVHHGLVRTRNVAGAWQMVRDGRVPLAVEGMMDRQPVGGIATLRRVTVVQVLVTNARKPSYLVPAYRFQGTAHLASGAGTHTWYALVSAVRP